VTPLHNRAVEAGFDLELGDLRRAHESFFTDLMGGDAAVA
jgi:hypothetical protein